MVSIIKQNREKLQTYLQKKKNMKYNFHEIEILF